MSEFIDHPLPSERLHHCSTRPRFVTLLRIRKFDSSYRKRGSPRKLTKFQSLRSIASDSDHITYLYGLFRDCARQKCVAIVRSKIFKQKSKQPNKNCAAAGAASRCIDARAVAKHASIVTCECHARAGIAMLRTLHCPNCAIRRHAPHFR